MDDKATFTVEAIGEGELIYQWRRNGVPIPGETKDTLRFTDVAPEDCGTITVAVEDGRDSTISTKARFTPDLPLALGNNNFSERFVLTPAGGGYVHSISTTLTDKEQGEPNHAGEPGGRSLWYRWTAPANGVATFSSRGSGFDTVLAVYEYDRAKGLTPVSTTSGDDDSGGFQTSRVGVNVQADQEYAIAVDGFDGAFGDVILKWNFTGSPVLLPGIATVLPDTLTFPYGTNATLTLEYRGGTGLWYHDELETGDDKGSHHIDKLDEAQVGRYYVEVTAQEDPTKRVRSRPTDVQINIADDSSNPNLAAFDKFLRSAREDRAPKGLAAPAKKGGSTANAGTARGYTTTQIFSTVGSTKDEDEPNHCGVVGGASEWFSYKAPAAGEMYVNTDGTSFNSVVAVYTGSGFDYASLSAVACNNASGSGKDRVHFSCTSGKTYYIAVDGVGGATGTVKLNVYVGDPPAFTAQPTSQTVLAGTNITLSCAVTGSTNFNYQWRRNGTNLSGATASTLTLNNVQATNGGNYTVYVSNLVNVVTSSNALLSVGTAPALVTQPTARSVNVGQSTAFSVSATGTDPLFYFWRFNGTNIVGATTTGYTVSGAQLTNAGNYSVVVSNFAGTATSSNALLTVNFAPVLLSQPVSQTVKTNTGVVLAVSASAAPSPTYQWAWNGTNLAAATNSNYTIASFLTNHEGYYSVLVSNSQGTAQSTNAQLLANAPVRLGSFGRGTNGQFELQLIGAAGSNYVLQASSNLVLWTPLMTNTATTGLLYFRDTNSAVFSNRFYRMLTVP